MEGAWLSLLNNDTDPVAAAGALKEANIAAVNQLDASTDNADGLRDAVASHTAHFWSSIEWQLNAIRHEQAKG